MDGSLSIDGVEISGIYGPDGVEANGVTGLDGGEAMRVAGLDGGEANKGVVGSLSMDTPERVDKYRSSTSWNRTLLGLSIGARVADGSLV